MKWANRIAQGFSPGKTVLGNRPESEDRLARLGKPGWNVRRCFIPGRPTCRLRRASVFGRHCQGDPRAVPDPGLKPWAVLLDHFWSGQLSPLAARRLLLTYCLLLTAYCLLRAQSGNQFETWIV